MNKYLKEIVAVLTQILVFYVSPLFAGPTDTMGVIVLMLILTLTTSIIYGIVSNEKIKYLFPVIVALVYLPTVFIYFNESALVHTAWYLIISMVGIIVGTVINKVINIIKK